MELTAELLDTLTNTPFCRPAIAELADQLSDLTPKSAGMLSAQLAERGEDVALSRLLTVCAYRTLLLDPSVLTRSAGVVSDIAVLPYCFTRHDEAAIAPLLEASRSEELSWERRAVLARLAAELALRHDTARDEVMRRLRSLLAEVPTHPTDLLLLDTLGMIESGDLKEGLLPLMTELDIQAELPENPPPTIIGGGETVRRPIPKLGRNDPCHCGSGKKYKRCCFAKDREMLADASSYSGVTQTQIRENPGIVDDARLIRRLRAYEVKKLEPGKLSTDQLFAACDRAKHFGLVEIAFDMLVERSKRTDGAFPFDPGSFADLMDAALSRGNLDIAQRARDLVPADCDYVDWDEVDMEFDLCSNPGLVETVETRCKEAFCSPVDERGFRDHAFCGLAHTFRHRFPALSILFARAAVQECPDRVLDNELLVENVHQARIDLGLDPWNDPIDAAFDEAEEAQTRDEEDKDHARESQALHEQLAQAREQTRSATRRLDEQESALHDLKCQLDRATAPREEPVSVNGTPGMSLVEAEETMTRLRRQVDNLKVEIGNQQEERRRLRRELERERKRARHAPTTTLAQQEEFEATAAPEMPAEDARKVIIPAYDPAFHAACRDTPPSIAASALKAVTAFAVFDPAIWRHARGIRHLPNIYRVRIGLHYRLLLRWFPGQNLTALDLIPRQELETWIKRRI